MKNEKNWIGIALILVGIIWFFVAQSALQETNEDLVSREEKYSDLTIVISSVISLTIIFYPTYKFMSKGLELANAV